VCAAAASERGARGDVDPPYKKGVFFFQILYSSLISLRRGGSGPDQNGAAGTASRRAGPILHLD
jgi:hypothetical protein